MTTKTKVQDKHKMSEIDENISKLFDIKKRLGKGAYGIVWKALDKRTNETLAVKKIFDAFRDETDAQRTFREIVFLNEFRTHPNIIKLHNVYRASNNLDIYLIFEYMESDLHNIIKKGTILKDIHKRYIMYQLINAIKYIHSGNVIHRDLKPSNVLIDSKCRCKLADFGLARSVANRPVRENNDCDVVGEPLLTDYVATRWYRAPEILVASKRYTKGIDMWSLGCILGEMIRGKPLFQGTSTVNQIEKIVTALPEITDHDINAIGCGFGSVLLSKQISRDRKTSLDELLPDAPTDALNLVKSLLVLDPLGRLTAKQALCNHYVEKFRNSIPELELSRDILPPFRDDVRLSVPEYRSKLYEIVLVTTDKSNNSKQQITNNGKLNFKSRDESSSISNIYDKRALFDHNKKSSAKLKSNQRSSTDKYIYKEKFVGRLEKLEKVEKPVDVNDEQRQQQQSYSVNNIINRALKKAGPSSPLPKRKHHRSTSKVNMPMEANKQERSLERSKSRIHLKNSQETMEHERLKNLNNKRHSIDGGYGSLRHQNALDRAPQAQAVGNSLGSKPANSGRIYKSSSSLHRIEANAPNISNNNSSSTPPHHYSHSQQLKYLPLKPPIVGNNKEANDRLNRSTPLVSKKSTYIRNTKSDLIPTDTNAKTMKSQERLCYEKRLKSLEDDIEKYKEEVKSFCRNTFKYPQQPEGEDNNNTRSKLTKKSGSSAKGVATNSTNFWQQTPKKHNNVFSKGNCEMEDGSGDANNLIGSSSHHIQHGSKSQQRFRHISKFIYD